MELFHPRRIDKRIEKLPSLEKRMFFEFTEGKEIQVYINVYEAYVKAIILDDIPTDDFVDGFGEGETFLFNKRRDWAVYCRLFIKKDCVEENEYYGEYDVNCQWDKVKEEWRLRNIMNGRWNKCKLKSKSNTEKMQGIGKMQEPKETIHDFYEKLRNERRKR